MLTVESRLHDTITAIDDNKCVILGVITEDLPIDGSAL